MKFLLKPFSINALCVVGWMVSGLGFAGLLWPKMDYDPGHDHAWYTPYVYLLIGGMLMYSGMAHMQREDGGETSGDREPLKPKKTPPAIAAKKDTDAPA